VHGSNPHVQEEAYLIKDPEYWSNFEDEESDVSDADSPNSQPDIQEDDKARMSFDRAMKRARELEEFFDVAFLVGSDLTLVCGVGAVLSSQSR
jgi:hypothetical protein